LQSIGSGNDQFKLLSAYKIDISAGTHFRSFSTQSASEADVHATGCGSTAVGGERPFEENAVDVGKCAQDDRPKTNDAVRITGRTLRLVVHSDSASQSPLAKKLIFA
jgi:hypothetical protein